MALTIAQKSNCRRHLGYPAIGLYTVSPGSGTFAKGSAGYRFFQAYGFMEYKLDNLAPDEEARVTGNAYAAIALTGTQPNTGDSISVTLSGGNIASPQTITATMPPPNGDQGQLRLLALLANACAQNIVLQAAGIFAVQPYGTGPYAQSAVPIPELCFEGPVPFSIAVGASGSVFPAITATGAQLPPTTSLDDGLTTLFGYLPICDGLEGAWMTSSSNLDTIKADVWTGRGNEAGARQSLYSNWRAQMADFLNIPMWKSPNNMARRGAITFV